MFPATPSSAETVYHHFPYTCTDGALRRGSNLEVEVAIPKSVRVGERIPLQWTLSQSPLASSAKFKAGGRLYVTATVDVGGLWQGKLDSTGSKEQSELALGGPLELPTAISGAVSTTKEGKLFITPRDLAFDFTPPADTVKINDTDLPNEQPSTGPHAHPPVNYLGEWVYSGKGDRAGLGDYQEDVHASNKNGTTAEMTFVGTGIEYIAERASNLGEVQIEVRPKLPSDGAPPVVKVDAFDKDTAPTKPKAQEILYSKKGLRYGDYKITLTNLAADDTYMVVDAFNVITETLSVPPSYFRTNCRYTGTSPAATVDVVAAAANNGDGSNGGNNGNGQVTDGDDSARGVIVLSGGGQGHGAPTATATATKTAKATKTSKATKTPQVRVTPKGGAHTGEAPGRDTSAPLLIGYGTTLALGGVVGGLALRRRRAVHGSADRGSLG